MNEISPKAPFSDLSDTIRQIQAALDSSVAQVQNDIAKANQAARDARRRATDAEAAQKEAEKQLEAVELVMRRNEERLIKAETVAEDRDAEFVELQRRLTAAEA
ncbi:MAG: hypothetical protein AAF220_15020, partial [Pseudomonadota bacterium]